MRSKLNKAQKVARDNRFIAGIEQHLAREAIIINKGHIRCAEIADHVREHVALVTAVNAAHAALRQAVKAERAKDAEVTALMGSVQALMRVQFGEGSEEYTDFGFRPRKKRVQTPESKARAADRLRATRAARHTMGKRQRSAITGNVESPPTDQED